MLNVEHGRGRIFRRNQAAWHKAWGMLVLIQGGKRIAPRFMSAIAIYKNLEHIVFLRRMQLLPRKARKGFSAIVSRLRTGGPALLPTAACGNMAEFVVGVKSSQMRVQFSFACSSGDAVDIRAKTK